MFSPCVSDTPIACNVHPAYYQKLPYTSKTIIQVIIRTSVDIPNLPLRTALPPPQYFAIYLGSSLDPSLDTPFTDEL